MELLFTKYLNKKMLNDQFIELLIHSNEKIINNLLILHQIILEKNDKNKKIIEGGLDRLIEKLFYLFKTREMLEITENNLIKTMMYSLKLQYHENKENINDNIEIFFKRLKIMTLKALVKIKKYFFLIRKNRQIYLIFALK